MDYQNRANASTGSALPVRVSGIDVDRLLHDIGEASASSSPIELFRLYLRAQSVLAEVGADAHPKPAETRMVAVPHGGGERVRTHPGKRLTDADYAAIVKRYEDAGDMQNADIIRKQWEVARRPGVGIAGFKAKHGPSQYQNDANGVANVRT